MKISRLLILCSLVIFVLSCQSTEPYKNVSLSPEERAMDLLSRMTLEEKLSQTMNSSPAIPRLGIPAMDWWNEALHGIARAGHATVFPQPIGLAASFDTESVQVMYDMISDEGRAKHHDFKKKNQFDRYKGLTFWTPNINIFRDPRWGRGMETWGEDPYLTARMGVAVVKGLQGDGSQKYDKAHACAKHYAVHSGPEWNRHSYDAKGISQRDLWETYLPAFKALVQEGGVKEVMCAYNRFEGEPCCSSDQLLIEILRDQWEFDGVVVSDCGAIDNFYYKDRHATHNTAAEASADAVITGTDLECGYSYESLKEAYDRGLLTEEDIDRTLFRLLRARFQLGMFDDDSQVSWASIPYSVVESQTHLDKAEEMARKSMVLLKNSNQTLPLSKNARIAVIGPNAKDSIILRGNYYGYPTTPYVTILDGIRNKLPENNIFYHRGCDYLTPEYLTSLVNYCSFEGKPGMKASFWNNTDLQGDANAVEWLTTPIKYNNGGTVIAPGIDIGNFSVRYEMDFISPFTGDVALRISTSDGKRVYVDGEKVIDAWENREHPDAEYILQAIEGNSYTIVVEYFHHGWGAYLSFDLGKVECIDFNHLASLVKEYDAIIFAGGISPDLEGEEMGVDAPGFLLGDRTAIELPEVQQKMLQALKGTGKPVIFVLCSGSSMALPWEDKNLDAILAAWYPGQRGGNAVGDVLFGDYNPGGRLPLTFYSSTNELPDYEDYDMSKGRTYRYYTGEPIYPFGHGLSYTTFDYKDVRLSSDKIESSDGVTLAVTLENTGTRDGDEVIQVYIRNAQDTDGPLKSLRGYQRTFLKAGEIKTVTIELPSTAFEFFDSSTQEIKVKPGVYEVLYGGSSDDKLLKTLAIEVI